MGYEVRGCVHLPGTIRARSAWTVGVGLEVALPDEHIGHRRRDECRKFRIQGDVFYPGEAGDQTSPREISWRCFRMPG